MFLTTMSISVNLNGACHGKVGENTGVCDVLTVNNGDGTSTLSLYCRTRTPLEVEEEKKLNCKLKPVNDEIGIGL